MTKLRKSLRLKGAGSRVRIDDLLITNLYLTCSMLFFPVLFCSFLWALEKARWASLLNSFLPKARIRADCASHPLPQHLEVDAAFGLLAAVRNDPVSNI